MEMSVIQKYIQSRYSDKLKSVKFSIEQIEFYLKECNFDRMILEINNLRSGLLLSEFEQEILKLSSEEEKDII